MDIIGPMSKTNKRLGISAGAEIQPVSNFAFRANLCYNIYVR